MANREEKGNREKTKDDQPKSAPHPASPFSWAHLRTSAKKAVSARARYCGVVG